MNKTFLFLSILLFYSEFFSQTNLPGEVKEVYEGKISGRIIDSALVEPIDYASVGLLLQENDKEVNGTTSDAKGNFLISNVPDGNYKIVIYFMGYKNRTVTNILIDKTNRKVNLGDIRLVNTVTDIGPVVITGHAKIIDYKIDKIVYNAENDVTTQGGAAIDILRKVPQVNVDVDGNVELQGNSNIRFLINGKPSSIFGNSLADALASIPASQIKSIEAITSPGAKYDAQGTGGIINIILKDNKVKGFNGNTNLSAGTRFETGSMNLSVRNNNFGMNAFFGGNAQLTSHTPNSQDRTSTDVTSQTNTHLVQNGSTDFQRNGYNTGVGFDWSMNKMNNLTGSITYNQFSNQNVNTLNQEQVTKDNTSVVLTDIVGSRYSKNNSSVGSMDWNLNYKKTFKKEGQELTASYVSSYGIPNSNYVQTQSYAGSLTPYNGMVSNNPGKDNNRNISVDYIHPLTEKFLIETGVKHVEQDINSATDISFLDPSTNSYQNDPLQSFHMKYSMRIYAAYLSSSFTLFNWLNVKVGLRDEYTGIKIDYPNTTVPSYNVMVPSLNLSHKLKKDQEIKLAYTRKIQRPAYSDLNPFVNLSDPHNISTGNPKLKPEIGDNFEFGYSKTFEKGGNIYIGVTERINTQDLKAITTFYPTYQVGSSVYINVSVTKRQNIGAEYNSGGNISASFPITKNFNIRGNVNLTNRYIVSSLLGNIAMGFRFRANLNITYQLPKNLIIEAFGNYNSAAKNVQGINPQSVTYTIACRKQFWNKKASFGFTATNPFNKYIRQETTTVTSNYVSTSIRQLPYRSFGISFTYKFGKLEFKKTKEDVNEYLKDLPN